MLPLVIVNPIAGRTRAAKAIRRIDNRLRQLGLHHTVRFTTRPLEAQEIANQAVAKGCKLVIVVGGDGTVNEVINGIVGSDCLLGVIPQGSGNDFARMLNISQDIDTACEQIAMRHEIYVDLGCVKFDNEKARYFAVAMGIGYDALVSLFSSNIKSKLYWLPNRIFDFPIYVYTALKVFPNARPFSLLILKEPPLYIECFVLSITNGKTLAGGLTINPKAKFDDGVFDLCIFRPMKFIELLGIIPKVISGSHIRHPKVVSLISSIFVIKVESQVHIHLDGEVFEVTNKILKIENKYREIRAIQGL